jgi:hypothetical protein
VARYRPLAVQHHDEPGRVVHGITCQPVWRLEQHSPAARGPSGARTGETAFMGAAVR